MINIKLKMISFLIPLLLLINTCFAQDNITDNMWFYPEWVANTQYNLPITVVDTNSALGRYSSRLKEINLMDIAKYHGHLCDGMVIAYIELRAVLEMLFPDGKIDRTDIRVISKNGPCWVDVATYMTGARINFETLSLDNSLGDGFIVQKISTAEAYDVHLKPGVFPEEMAALEKKIKLAHFNKQIVNPEDIDTLETMANDLIKKLLTTGPDKLIVIKQLKKFDYSFNFKPGIRTDIINKNVIKNSTERSY